MTDVLTMPRAAIALPAHERIGNVLVASFRFSQGDPTLQARELNYVLQDFGKVALRDNMKAALAHGKVKAKEIVGRSHVTSTVTSKNFSPSAVNSEFKGLHSDVLKGFLSDERDVKKGYLDDEEGIFMPKSELLPLIAEGILARDSRYARKVDGKERRVGSSDGQYFSYFMRHVAMGRSAGVPEFTSMFETMKSLSLGELRSETEEDEQTRTLGIVMEAHIAENNEDKAAIDAWHARAADEVMAA